MQAEILHQYLQCLQAGDTQGILALFAGDGTVISPLFSTLPAVKFYPLLEQQTRSSELDFKRLFVDPENPLETALFFTYHWTRADGSKVAFDCVDLVTFNASYEITQLHIIYDTAGLRPAQG